MGKVTLFAVRVVDSNAIWIIYAIWLKINTVHWRDYLLRDFVSMYSDLKVVTSCWHKYLLSPYVFFIYSTDWGILRTEIWRVLQQLEYCRFWQVLSAFMKKHHGIATAIVIRLYPKVIYTFFCMLTSLTLCQYIYLTSLTLCQDIYGTGTGAY